MRETINSSQLVEVVYCDYSVFIRRINFISFWLQSQAKVESNRTCVITFRTSRGMNSSIARHKVSRVHFKRICLFSKLISIKFAERQRELKRIGNMIDDIIASKWSRTTVRDALNVRLHKSDISHVHFIFIFLCRK